MKLFENKVGRPSNEILRKRKIFCVSVICLVLLIVGLAIGFLTYHNTNRLSGGIFDFGKKKYTIKYNLNGSVASVKLIDNCTVSEKDSCSVKLPKITPKAGYEVIGWSEKKDGTDQIYKVGTDLTINKDTTMYAITKKKGSSNTFGRKKFAVTFDKNESLLIGTQSRSCITLQDNCNIILPAIVSKPGFKVIGWSTDKEGNKEIYKVGQILNIKENITLYAISEKVSENTGTLRFTIENIGGNIIRITPPKDVNNFRVQVRSKDKLKKPYVNQYYSKDFYGNPEVVDIVLDKDKAKADTEYYAVYVKATTGANDVSKGSPLIWRPKNSKVNLKGWAYKEYKIEWK